MTSEDCIFCKIIKGEIPATKIYEDMETLAFLDIAPINIGHVLVIPKIHYQDIHETPDELAGHLMKVSKIIAAAVKKAEKADGINITMNNEAAAGQVIFHSHIHIIPRFKDDGFGVWYGKRSYNEGEKEEVAQKITGAL